MMNNRITVTIITKDEERNIARAIQSAQLMTDDIVLVDSGSTDKTVEIAKKMGVTTIHHEFENFAQQKNFAASKAKGDWIFSLDADEEITPQLAKEILEKTETDAFDGYLVPRRNFILKGEIKHSRWSPDKHIWLWQKGKGTWEGNVHEEVRGKGKVGNMYNGKLHYQDDTIFEFIESLNRYTSAEAHTKYAKGERYSFFEMIWDAKKSFIGRYVLKAGYKDGWRGFVLCILRAFYKIVMWLKLLELQKSK